jgi:4a-hydroxytetrahydrobiopterin dehydratase
VSTKALTGQQISDAHLTGWTILLSGSRPGSTPRASPPACGSSKRSAGPPKKCTITPNSTCVSRVDVWLTSREDGGVTENDVTLARRISEIADAGAEFECRGVSRIELGLDTPAYDKIAPFWTAVLDTEQVIGNDDRGDVGDPHQALAMVWSSGPAARSPDSAGIRASGSTRRRCGPGSTRR